MTAPAPARAQDSGLVRAIGVRRLAASIVNVTVGGGIFALPAAVAASVHNGAPAAYLLCFCAMYLIVECFAQAGSRVDLTGGPYAYVEVAFGRFVGFLSGVLLWLAGTFAMSAVSTLVSGSLGRLVPALAGAGAQSVVLIALFAAFAWVNVTGVRQGARLNELFTVAKLLPLLLFVVVGAIWLATGHGAGFVPDPERATPRAIAGSAVVLIFAFAGVEAALVPSGEVRDPARTVPRAVRMALPAITLLYIAIQLVSQGVLGDALAAAKDAPLALASEHIVGAAGRTLMLGATIVSTLGYVGGMTLAIPRSLFAFARDGMLPRIVARVHPRHHTPDVAIVAQAAIACALAVSGTFIKLLVLANVSLLLLYLACCAAAWELGRRDVRGGGVPYATRGGNIVPWLAIAMLLGLLAVADRHALAVVGVVMLIAAALFVVRHHLLGRMVPT